MDSCAWCIVHRLIIPYLLSENREPDENNIRLVLFYEILSDYIFLAALVPVRFTITRGHIELRTMLQLLIAIQLLRRANTRPSPAITIRPPVARRNEWKAP